MLLTPKGCFDSSVAANRVSSSSSNTTGGWISGTVAAIASLLTGWPAEDGVVGSSFFANACVGEAVSSVIAGWLSAASAGRLAGISATRISCLFSLFGTRFRFANSCFSRSMSNGSTTGTGSGAGSSTTAASASSTYATGLWRYVTVTGRLYQYTMPHTSNTLAAAAIHHV